MNEDSSITPPTIPDGLDMDVVSMLKRIQQQLLLLEKKVDLLIGQSQDRRQGEKAFSDRLSKRRPFSKQLRSSDPGRHRSRGDHEYGPRESDSAKGHFYEHRPGGRSHGPSHRKKPFSFKRKDPS